MTKAKSRARPGLITPGDKAPQRGVVSTEDRFPPLSTSLEIFTKDGSDRELRRLIYDLTSLANLMVRTRRNFAAYIGVTEAQALMMMIIAETQGTTVGHIAQQLDVSSQFVTTEIGDLVKKSIVEKRLNEADRRSMFLDLTSKGKSLFREMAPLRCKVNDTMFRSFSEDRARAFKDTITALISDTRIALYELGAPDQRGKTAPSAQSETKANVGAGRATPRNGAANHKANR
jgi:DNA-binding MarR family transcriptional regulator